MRNSIGLVVLVAVTFVFGYYVHKGFDTTLIGAIGSYTECQGLVGAVTVRANGDVQIVEAPIADELLAEIRELAEMSEGRSTPILVSPCGPPNIGAKSEKEKEAITAEARSENAHRNGIGA